MKQSTLLSLTIFSVRRLSESILIASLLWITLVASASAQTDFSIKTNTPDLEAEYKKELDKWILQAYEGDRDAQFKAGVLFTNEQFEDPDHEQAVYWYKQAARQGHVLAQYNLGHHYLTGVGVKRDETTAMSWWLKAAEQDHALAQFNVGRAYYLGIGLQQDHDQSRHWFERAAQNQEQKSIDVLEQLGWAKPGQYQRTLATDTPAESEFPAGLELEIAANQIENPINAVPESTPAESTQLPDRPIALYTDPSVRSVLIAILNIRDQLTVISRSEEWTSVTSDTGFPVWVHGDYIAVSNDIGTITGNAVNARSVPLVTAGTVVGKFENEEMLDVLDQRDGWFRVMSPKRFEAWVKTAELERDAEQNSTTVEATPEYE